MVVVARHRNYNIERRIPHEFSVDTLVHTWSPRFVPFLDPGEWPPYDGPKYIVDPTYRWNKHGSRQRTKHRMVMARYPEERGVGEELHLLLTPSSKSTASTVDLATIHEVAIC